ncbi:hypothetical protein C8R45DRAFT_972981 [Mycena sanguinolenta]|nr:hypothetical protein C8R45DRAFT_972981 [Mycena sanguinolenta]
MQCCACHCPRNSRKSHSVAYSFLFPYLYPCQLVHAIRFMSLTSTSTADMGLWKTLKPLLPVRILAIGCLFSAVLQLLLLYPGPYTTPIAAALIWGSEKSLDICIPAFFFVAFVMTIFAVYEVYSKGRMLYRFGILSMEYYRHVLLTWIPFLFLFFLCHTCLALDFFFLGDDSRVRRIGILNLFAGSVGVLFAGFVACKVVGMTGWFERWGKSDSKLTGPAICLLWLTTFGITFFVSYHLWGCVNDIAVSVSIPTLPPIFSQDLCERLRLLPMGRLFLELLEGDRVLNLFGGLAAVVLVAFVVRMVVRRRTLLDSPDAGDLIMTPAEKV